MKPKSDKKKHLIEFTPEQLYEVYLECNVPGASVKAILEKHGLTPRDIEIIRKKVKTAVLEALSRTGKPGRKKGAVPVEKYQEVTNELKEAKDALKSAGQELSRLKKRTS